MKIFLGRFVSAERVGGGETSAGEGKKDSRHFIGKKILDAKQDMDSFFINYDNMKEFNKTSIYRVATEKQFVPPYCIIKKGLNVNTYRMRAAYSEKEFLYIP